NLDHRVGNSYKWLCICACGKECTPTGPHLVRGDSTSCGKCNTKGSAFRDLLCEYKISARRRDLSWELSEDQFQTLTSSPCHYTGRFPENSKTVRGDVYVFNGIDRKDNST